MSKWGMIFLAGAALMFGAQQAKADSTPVLLKFEGAGNFVTVGNFYNGGAGGNLGVVFGSVRCPLFPWRPVATGILPTPLPETRFFFSWPGRRRNGCGRRVYNRLFIFLFCGTRTRLDYGLERPGRNRDAAR